MIEAKIKGSHREIYVGGGNFITQACPTNHHGFWKRRFLTSEESIDDYKEVTAAQKSTIEAADAKWVEPSEDFIRECKAMGVVYNRATGYFELNGLVDITTEQMQDIMKNGRTYYPYPRQIGRTCRTNILCSNEVMYNASFWGVNATNLASGANKLEVLRLTTNPNNVVQMDNASGLLFNCNNLKKIIGVISLYAMTAANAPSVSWINFTYKLEEMFIADLKISLNFKVQHIKPECIEFMVDRARNTVPITVTLHPDAYARLTDELIEKASARQITFATTQ